MSRRVPWWLWSVLVTCAAYLVVLWGVLLAGPEPLGGDFDAQPDGGGSHQAEHLVERWHPLALPRVQLANLGQ